MRFALWIFPALLAAEWSPLFTGANLDGWTHEGPAATFAAVKGELTTSGRGNYPNWLRTDREYENFRLEFEYNLSQWAEAAVVLRAPKAGRPAQAGLAIVLAHDYHEKINSYVTGGVAGALPPRKALPASWGAWRRAEISLDGSRLVCRINSELVQEVDLAAHPELRLRLKRGHIGFQDLGYAYRVRNLRIEDLGTRLKIVDLFDGRSLTGWTLRDGGVWSVRDGAILGANGHGILYAPGDYRDFELTLLARSRNRVNGGVFLRGQPSGPNRGFEVQIYSPPDGVYPTGSIYGIERTRGSGDFEDRWFLMQILVQGRRCVVRVDGETVAETDEAPERYLGPGRIGLQIHKEDSSLEVRDMRVRPL